VKKFTTIWRIAGSAGSADGEFPDHSTFSKNGHGHFRETDALRRLFERMVQRCIAESLVSAEGFAVDASLIVADANKGITTIVHVIVFPNNPNCELQLFKMAVKLHRFRPNAQVKV
jgi:hypothetical protein